MKTTMQHVGGAIRRYMRRHPEANPGGLLRFYVLHTSYFNKPKPAALVWHLASVVEWNHAGVARRAGQIDRAFLLVQAARQARIFGEKAKG